MRLEVLFLFDPSRDGAVMPSWFDIYEIPVTAGSLENYQNSNLGSMNRKNSKLDELSTIITVVHTRELHSDFTNCQESPKDENSVLKAVQTVHAMIDKEIANGTPILWSHGLADRTVLFEAGQAGPPFLEQAGMSCEFKAYPNVGHSIANEELRYLESWIRTRLKSSS
ncbi:hypothetical protein C4D60_Mb03t22360 [Musa balbisiana]|uniref:Phospholipase/carboxylesterase/thioesterase domain-containing protein n=1 Tax=Musa balbisiana TaxID=52838 RepID=A0A4S8JCU9_MUSBA|nr:hypothetical protein C4D60_Mb03t22360 [Musa balbisiana]